MYGCFIIRFEYYNNMSGGFARVIVLFVEDVKWHVELNLKNTKVFHVWVLKINIFSL